MCMYIPSKLIDFITSNTPEKYAVSYGCIAEIQNPRGYSIIAHAVSKGAFKPRDFVWVWRNEGGKKRTWLAVASRLAKEILILRRDVEAPLPRGWKILRGKLKGLRKDGSFIYEPFEQPRKEVRIMKRRKVTIYFDGSRSKDGAAACGLVFVGERGTKKEFTRKLPDDYTHNEAEWTALWWALKKLTQKRISGWDIVIKGDSQLVVKQINGEWKLKKEKWQRVWNESQEMIQKLKSWGNTVKIIWIPREENLADKVSR